MLYAVATIFALYATVCFLLAAIFFEVSDQFAQKPGYLFVSAIGFSASFAASIMFTTFLFFA